MNLCTFPGCDRDKGAYKPEHLQRASQVENTLEMLSRNDYEARIAALEARVRELETELDTHRWAVR